MEENKQKKIRLLVKVSLTSWIIIVEKKKAEYQNSLFQKIDGAYF